MNCTEFRPECPATGKIPSQFLGKQDLSCSISHLKSSKGRKRSVCPILSTSVGENVALYIGANSSRIPTGNGYDDENGIFFELKRLELPSISTRESFCSPNADFALLLPDIFTGS